MEHIGIDVHKRQSQICRLTAEGCRIERRIATTPGALAAALGERAPAPLLIEASTESEWVARCLEQLGHTVIVADPNFAPMYATRNRAVKTDRRDARALADACRLGAYRPAHRLSDAQRAVRARLTVRDALVRTRTRAIAVTRALLRQHGWRVPSGSAETFIARVRSLPLPGRRLSEIAPLLAVILPVNAQLAYADGAIAQLTRPDPRVQLLQTMPFIGPVTTAAFVAALDDAARFHHAHQVEAYLGLVPRERSSGDTQHRGRITKAGNVRVRWLLVQAALSIRRARNPRTAPPGRLGHPPGRPPRQEDRHRRPRPPPGRHPLRHAPGRHPVHADPPPHALRRSPHEPRAAAESLVWVDERDCVLGRCPRAER